MRCGYSFPGILSRKDGTILAALSFGSYVIIYIISSAIFVAMDKFTINNACMLAMSTSVCMFGLGLVFKCYPKVDISLKSIADWLIPIAIFVAFAILSERDSDISEWVRMKVYTRLRLLPI